ncbi:MAG: hypothetical protein K2J85_06915 [Anaeroplasmataceae bacterium]|nr:hypothetical protein [Anaeroplasmataceae bacterium]
MEIDLTSSYDELYVPKNYLASSETLDIIQENSIVVWENKFETSVVLIDSEKEIARVSYAFFENLELELNSIYVICNLSQIFQIDNTLNSLGYHTFKLQNFNMKPHEDSTSLFKANTTFFCLNIVLAILIYILLKVSYKKLLKVRQKEFTLLKKLGFSNKTIYIHMICPILLSAILVILSSPFIYLVRPFIIWYFYVIPVCIIGIVTYHVCKNIYIQYNSILKEVK